MEEKHAGRKYRARGSGVETPQAATHVYVVAIQVFLYAFLCDRSSFTMDEVIQIRIASAVVTQNERIGLRCDRGSFPILSRWVDKLKGVEGGMECFGAAS